MTAAVEVLRNSGAYLELAYTLIDRAEFLRAGGMLGAAERDHRWCLDLCDQGQLFPTARAERGRLAYVLYLTGRWQEGGQMVDLHVHYGTVHWMAGNHAAALRYLEAEAALLRAVGDVVFLAPLVGVHASFLLQMGCLEAAHRLARDSFALLRQSGCRGLLFWLGGPLAESAIGLATEDAAELLAELEAAVAASSALIERPALLRARAALLRQQGRLTEACDLLVQSTTLARHQGALIEWCRSLHVLSSAAREAGDQALADRSDIERRALITAIGPTTAGLVWAGGSA
jgi:hypothetical protein